MGKAPAADTIMSAEKMKPLLTMSKREPVQAAIALTGEGEGVMLLDKKAKPRKVLAMLRTSAGKTKMNLSNSSLRFGRAEVDPDYDSAIVRLFVNKDPPGPMRIKLTEVVKRIAYQKVEFIIDPSLEEEPDDDEDAPEATASVPEAPPAPPAGPDMHALTAELAALLRRLPEAAGTDATLKARLVKLATDANTTIKAGDADSAPRAITALREAIEAAGQRKAEPAEAPDEAGTKAQLADLVRRIAGASANDPALKANLAKLAGDANAAIKAHDTARAAALIAQLREALEGAGKRGAATNGAAPGWKDARQAWLDANDAVNDQLNALRIALVTHANDEPEYANALKEIADKGLNGVTGSHRVALMAALTALGDGSPAALNAGGGKALEQVAAFRTFIADSDQIRVCDANPFQVPVSIRATLTPALAGLELALRPAA